MLVNGYVVASTADNAVDKRLSPLQVNQKYNRLLNWETWHWLVKYIPMIPFWIGHCIRARSLWFFTASNPTLTFGGYQGEPKTEMYNLLPLGTYPRTIWISPSTSINELKKKFLTSAFNFPVAVKPNVGRMGLMFRRIASWEELINFHYTITVEYVLQEFIDLPVEVSVFYYRYPDKKRGCITGFVRKEPLTVFGDGKSTLLQLIEQHPRASLRLPEMTRRHQKKLNEVLPGHERFVLCEALNLSRGGKLVSLENEKDDKLINLFDNLSHHGQFFYGRYDIRCKSIDDLKEGKNFSILEFNGSGAEPHHVYGNDYSFGSAIAVLLEHWRILTEISIKNHKRGIPYWSFRQGLDHMIHTSRQIRVLEELERTFPNKESHHQEYHITEKQLAPNLDKTADKVY